MLRRQADTPGASAPNGLATHAIPPIDDEAHGSLAPSWVLRTPWTKLRERPGRGTPAGFGARRRVMGWAGKVAKARIGSARRAWAVNRAVGHVGHPAPRLPEPAPTDASLKNEQEQDAGCQQRCATTKGSRHARWPMCPCPGAGTVTAFWPGSFEHAEATSHFSHCRPLAPKVAPPKQLRELELGLHSQCCSFAWGERYSQQRRLGKQGDVI